MSTPFGTISTHSTKKFDLRLYKKADRIRFQEAKFETPGNRTPPLIAATKKFSF